MTGHRGIEGLERFKAGPDLNGRPRPMRKVEDGPFVRLSDVQALLTQQDKEAGGIEEAAQRLANAVNAHPTTPGTDESELERAVREVTDLLSNRSGNDEQEAGAAEAGAAEAGAQLAWTAMCERTPGTTRNPSEAVEWKQAVERIIEDALPALRKQFQEELRAGLGRVAFEMEEQATGPKRTGSEFERGYMTACGHWAADIRAALDTIETEQEGGE